MSQPFDLARSPPPICPQRTTVYQVRTGQQPGSVTYLRVQRHWVVPFSLWSVGSVAPTVRNEQPSVDCSSNRGAHDRQQRMGRWLGNVARRVEKYRRRCSNQIADISS